MDSIESAIILNVILLIVGVIMIKIRRYYIVSCILTLLFVLLGGTYFNQFNIHKQPRYNFEKKISWIGGVESISKRDGRVKSLIIEIKKIKRDSIWQRADLFVSFQSKGRNSELRVGDIISGKSKLNRYKTQHNPAQFDFSAYMANRGVYYYSFEKEFTLHTRQTNIISIADQLRNKAITAFEEMGIQGDEKAVLIALCLGDKSGLDNDLKSSYAAAGAMHILAVSGLHVGIIFLLFNQLMKRFPNSNLSRWLKAIVLLVAIWVFATLTGLSSSVQRASWMFSFIVLSKALNRNSNVLNSIAGSAIILLLINPNVLFEVGFQLSYAAVIGIVLIYPILNSWVATKYYLLNKAWSLIVISFSATLATLPFTFFYFHQFPNWFLLTNLIIIPAVFTIVLGGILICLLWFLFEEDFLLAEILNYILKFLNKVIEWINYLPFHLTEGIWLRPLSITLLGSSIILFIIYLNFTNRKYLLTSLMSLTILLSIELLVDGRQYTNRFVGLYALKGTPIVAVNGLDAEVVCFGEMSHYDTKIVENHLLSLGVKSIKNIEEDKLSSAKYFRFKKSEGFSLLSALNVLIISPEKEEYIRILNDNRREKYLLFQKAFESIKSIEQNNSTRILLAYEFQQWKLKEGTAFNEKVGYSIKEEGYFQIDQ